MSGYLLVEVDPSLEAEAGEALLQMSGEDVVADIQVFQEGQVQGAELVEMIVAAIVGYGVEKLLDLVVRALRSRREAAHGAVVEQVTVHLRIVRSDEQLQIWYGGDLADLPDAIRAELACDS